MLSVGLASVAIDLVLPVAMSGFAARVEPAVRVDDQLTARAVIVDRTCIVAVDVVGLDAGSCDEIRIASGLADVTIVVVSTHTHCGPAVMPGRLGDYSRAARSAVIMAAARCVRRAAGRRRPVRLEYASVSGVGLAVDRRHGGRPPDAKLRALRAIDGRGNITGWLATYPCHPTVVGPQHHGLTADYPAYLRRALEAHAPGSTAIFLPGCAGDLNAGHTVADSYQSAPNSDRTIERAEGFGRALAQHIIDCPRWAAITGRQTRVARQQVTVRMEPLDGENPRELANRWRAEASGAPPGRRALLERWIAWAVCPTSGLPQEMTVTVTAFAWGSFTVVALPGEPFLAADIELSRSRRHRPMFVLGYADDCPGYFPYSRDFDDGGYEVVDSHRYYGMPAPFARGSAERLVEVASGLIDDVSADCCRRPQRASDVT